MGFQNPGTLRALGPGPWTGTPQAGAARVSDGGRGPARAHVHVRSGLPRRRPNPLLLLLRLAWGRHEAAAGPGLPRAAPTTPPPATHARSRPPSRPIPRRRLVQPVGAGAGQAGGRLVRLSTCAVTYSDAGRTDRVGERTGVGVRGGGRLCSSHG